MMPSPNRVPDYLLERLAAGELPPNQAASLRQRLAETGQTDRLAALADSNAQVLQTYPAEQVAAEVQRRAKRAEAARSRGWTRPVWALSLAAAGAAAVVVVMHKPTSNLGPVAQIEPEVTRDKGEKPAPSLSLYRQQGNGVEPLGPNSRLRAGDLVQVRYLAAGRAYGVVASMDARGSVTLHMPETPGPAAALAGEGERALAHAYELDDSPGFERFVFVTAGVPFDTGLVVRALKQGAALPKGYTLWSVTLAKDPR
jgi:hypothetical protein